MRVRTAVRKTSLAGAIFAGLVYILTLGAVRLTENGLSRNAGTEEDD